PVVPQQLRPDVVELVDGPQVPAAPVLRGHAAQVLRQRVPGRARGHRERGPLPARARPAAAALLALLDARQDAAGILRNGGRRRVGRHEGMWMKRTDEWLNILTASTGASVSGSPRIRVGGRAI